jgi:hypothetical protein
MSSGCAFADLLEATEGFLPAAREPDAAAAASLDPPRSLVLVCRPSNVSHSILRTLTSVHKLAV